MELVPTYKLFNLMTVRGKDGQDHPLNLWPEQINYFENYLYKYREIITLKARQKGFTLLHGLDSLFQGSFKRFRTIVLSKGETEAQEFLDKIKERYLTMPEDKQAIFGYSDKSFKSDFVLCKKTGSEIISLPCTGGRSFTSDRLIVDETAFVKKRYNGKIDLNILLASVTPVIEKQGGQLILMSTADGPDHFKKLYFDAKHGKNTYKAYFFPCFADPTFSQKDREDFEKKNGEALTNQEYPRTDSEAFLFSGRPVFDTKALGLYEANAMPYTRAAMDSPFNIQEAEKGEFRFILPYKKDGQYLISCDVSEGLANGDYTCAGVFDLQTKEIVAYWHGHMDFTLFGGILAMMGRHWNNAILAPETGVSAHGTTVVQALIQQEEYPRELIHQSKHVKPKSDDPFLNPMKRYGWVTNAITRAIIIEWLANLILTQAIPHLTDELILELNNFIRKDNGRTEAESGFNDDMVIMLAIGMYLINEYKYKPKPKDASCDNCAYRIFNKNIGYPECAKTKKILNRGAVYCTLWRFQKIQLIYNIPRKTKVKVL